MQLLAIPVLPKAETVAPVMIFCEGSMTQLSVGLQESLFILDMKEAASYDEVSLYCTEEFLLAYIVMLQRGNWPSNPSRALAIVS